MMDSKQEKRFKVRLELGMVITIGVDATDDQDAQKYATDILKDALCAPGNSDLYFCEIDNSDVYVNYADIKPLETYEDEE